MARDGSLRITPLLTGEARVTLENGAYPVAAGSRHLVEIRHPTGRTPPRTLHVTADPEGRLRFTESFSHHAVAITPVAEAARATARDEAHP
jgi:hypothetical protein